MLGDWEERLDCQFKKNYMLQLEHFLRQEKKMGKIIYPATEHIYQAFKSCQFNKTKVVIMGQDPYHQKNQAHGLSFSVRVNIDIPPSLNNIFKELCSDQKIPAPSNGCLQKWANQGVLLLNDCLTVEHGKPGSHIGKGWEKFTDAALESLNRGRENLVFILWGNNAKRKCRFINSQRHLILESPHPSPLSAYRGFFGSSPFSKTNNYLTSHNLSTINWRNV